MRTLATDPERLGRHPLLRWLGPALANPRLWRATRRGVALGVALGVFFGLLVPIAQIPLSVAASVALRANVPSAVASTLVTNPVTFAPIYYAAWRLGVWLTGDSTVPPGVEAPPGAPATLSEGPSAEPPLGWWQRITRVGKPLLVGLGLIAIAAGVLAYCVVDAAWRTYDRWIKPRRPRFEQKNRDQ